jgi:plastocyanin
MRRTVAALIVCLGAIASAMAPARAATVPVNVKNNIFDPANRVAVAGDTISFTWLEGQHTVTAISGGSFNSGVRSAGFQMTIPFDGATIKYRCTLHSQVSQFGDCQGMCGVIAEQVSDLTPPAVEIRSPRSRQIVIPEAQILAGSLDNPVVISGVASDNDRLLAVLVRYYDTLGMPHTQTATCDGCGSGNATFELRANMLPGSYVAEAIAIDFSGNQRTSERVPFFVL